MSNEDYQIQVGDIVSTNNGSSEWDFGVVLEINDDIYKVYWFHAKHTYSETAANVEFAYGADTIVILVNERKSRQ